MDDDEPQPELKVVPKGRELEIHAVTPDSVRKVGKIRLKRGWLAIEFADEQRPDPESSSERPQ